ncbi:DUF2272 domain-containing protein [Roseomonas populi]|uniref:DUF2272 domain-containing protein n=1 Tax=Roseomonas populi TaxID=3121582 RepID=A0ABT1X5Y3_9PROT|nr:DUF2272 domain-containing protein [Roseomonas pecuniae]MCR0983504.1 DUF2272 domain-containing protein [Roseomonas pecuniae]
MRRLLLLLPLLLVAACAADPPSPTTAPRASTAPNLRPAGPGAAQLVAAAEREWRDWGRIAVEGWPVALDRTPDATPELFDKLMSYWSATPDGPGIIQAHMHFRDTIAVPSLASASLDPVSGLPFNVVPANVAISSYNTPAWSAAFISYAMNSAGVAPSDFRSSSAHVFYMDGMIDNYLADPEGSAFRPHHVEEYAPRPGDLLCYDRSASPLPNWEARMAERGRSRPSHCDIVVRAGGGTIDIIGGNVMDVVLRRRIPTDAKGIVLPAPPERPPFFAIFENRR